MSIASKINDLTEKIYYGSQNHQVALPRIRHILWDWAEEIRQMIERGEIDPVKPIILGKYDD